MNGENEYVYDTNLVLASIDAQPSADVVEVVRCKDCIHRNPFGYKCLRDNLWHDEDGFCSYGEQKEWCRNDN